MVGGPGTLPELALVAAAGDGKEEVVRALLEAGHRVLNHVVG